jgi:hypothetical protein
MESGNGDDIANLDIEAAIDKQTELKKLDELAFD